MNFSTIMAFTRPIIGSIIPHVNFQYKTSIDERIILYKYNILERVLVENIIPRNMTINRGAAEVDNYISRDDFSTSTLSRMLYLFYYTEHLLTMVREVPKTTQCILCKQFEFSSCS